MPSLPLSRLLERRHARTTFAVRIELHEIVNVPLVSGRFRVKWRIEHETHGGSGHADDASSISESSLAGSEQLVAAKGGPSISVQRPSYQQSPQSSPQSLSHSRFDYDYHDSTHRGSSRQAAVSPISPRHGSPRTREQSANGRRNSTTHESPVEESEQAHDASGKLKSEAKGVTAWKAVSDHVVKLRRVVHCSISIPLARQGRSEHVLQPCHVKFVVYESLPIGPNGEQQDSRMGEVVLDLSDFAARPSSLPARDLKPARYLLQNCKSNAVLRMTIQVAWTGGERSFDRPNADGASRMTSSGSSHSLLGVLTGNRSTSQLSNSSQQSLHDNDDSSRHSQQGHRDSEEIERPPRSGPSTYNHPSTQDEASRFIDDLIGELGYSVPQRRSRQSTTSTASSSPGHSRASSTRQADPRDSPSRRHQASSRHASRQASLNSTTDSTSSGPDRRISFAPDASPRR